MTTPSNKRGCPTCNGVEPKSCLRCRGEARLSDWSDELPPPVREDAMTTPTPLQIEEDGDEVFCPVTRGCQQWKCVRDNGYIPVKLFAGPNGFWTCPKCKGCYGEVEP